jgi:pyruvate formate lyase activating enzyme
MIISGLQKFTVIDYPGKIAATVFLAGCNFRCPWCHNPELVLPEKIKETSHLGEKDFFNFLETKKGLLEGVVICGGEPCVNGDLPEFSRKIKDMGFQVKLDTNGSKPKMLNYLIEEKLIDYVAMDVKAPKEKYLEAIGLGNVSLKKIIKNIEESLDILKEDRVDYELRTTIIPYVLAKEDILNIAHWIEPARKYFLQNFQAEKTVDKNFYQAKPYLDEYLGEIREAIKPFFDICDIR